MLNHSAKLTIDHAFSKPRLVNLVSKGTTWYSRHSPSIFYLQGDGAAPLVCPDSCGVARLVGVASILPVYNCSFGVVGFTRISAVKKWIEDTQA